MKTDTEIAIQAMKDFLEATKYVDSNGDMWPAIWSSMCEMQNRAIEAIKFYED